MLWFRMGAVMALLFTFLLSIGLIVSVFIMCVNPANGRAMNTDPYYNGTLFFYILVIFTEIIMSGAAGFGFMVAFRVWRNNHQMDHTLRHLFSLWLAILGLATFGIFIMGILGLVRYREPQEEITSLFEIFAKYNQDIKFVGSFERFQRENSCCGINGPDDWMMAQFKSSSSAGGFGGMGYDSSYMGSPSTGKCHLTPPTIPMGCGKKVLEEVHFTMAVYSSVIILQTLCALGSACLGWYCFFYWIEKEVIIIPEDEVSNLIIIEPESSVSTAVSETRSGTRSGSRISSFHSGGGSGYSMNKSASQYYSTTGGSGSGSGSRFSRKSSVRPSSKDYLRSRFTYNGYSGSKSFYPNSQRSAGSRGTRLSNFEGAIPSIGGPHAEMVNQTILENGGIHNSSNYYPHMNGNYEPSYPQEVSGYTGNPDFHIYSQAHGSGSPATTNVSSYPQSTRLHQGRYGRSVFSNRTKEPSEWSNEKRTSYLPTSSLRAGSGVSFGSSQLASATSYLKPPKKERSKNHMLHLQEKALGGRVLAELHIDHSRDPDPLNSNMDIAEGRNGHRKHHATIAIIKNKHPPMPKVLFGKPEEGHGQTGHLAEDILEMSGGAAAAKSLIDDINLPVEHDPNLVEQGGGYVNKLHKARKQKSQLQHPDADHPGHGPVHLKDGKISAPSIDGSQAQLLMDELLKAQPKPKPKEPEIKAHSVKEKKKKDKTHHRPHLHENHNPSASFHQASGSNYRPESINGSLQTTVLYRTSREFQ